MSPPVLPDDTALRELAREILERPEYRRFRSLDADLMRRFAEVLSDFLGWMQALSVAAPLLYWTLLLGLLLVAMLLLTHVVISLRSALAKRGRAPERPAPQPGPRFAEEAEALAREGRFLEAARRLQLACIEVLLGRGVLELRRFEANRTLRRRIASAPLPPEQRREFTSLLERLETRFFRDRTDDRELFLAWSALHARIASGAPSP